MLNKEKNSFINLLFYLLLFIIFFMSGFNYLSILTFQSLFTLSIFLFYTNELISIVKEVKHKEIIFFLLAITSISISYFFSPILNINGLHNDYHGMTLRYFSSISQLLFFFSLFVFTKVTFFNFSKLINFLIFSFFLYIFLLITRNYFDHHLIGLDLVNNRRHLGYYFVFFIAIFMSRFAVVTLKDEKKSKQYLVSILIIAFTAFFIYVAGRGATLSLFACAVLLLFYIYKKNSLKLLNYLKNLSIILTTSILLSYVLPNFKIFETNQLEVLLKRTFTTENISSHRFYLWQTVIENNTRPIFGLGPNSFKHLRDNNKKIESIGAIQPHNIFIQFYLEWGIMGIFIICNFLLINLKKIFFNSFTKKDLNGVHIVSLSTLSSMIILSFFDGTFFYSQTLSLIIIFMVTGLYKK